jgi:DNA ligase-1
MNVATKEQWNDWYRRILIKDLRCGVSDKTVNKVLKIHKDIAPVPVFEVMLAHDGANHNKKIAGKKLLEPKLDGVRAITVVDFESRTATMYTRNGKVLDNFGHITSFLEKHMDEIGRSYVLDGEVVSNSFQDLMKQVHRKSDVQAGDARLCLFDVVPLVEFKTGKSVMGQRRRSKFLKENFSKLFGDSGCIEIIPQLEVNLDEFMGEIEYKDYNKKMVADGFEGIMIKDPEAKYECKRSTSWLKEKPFLEVSLSITAVEEGTGRNVGRLGALVCQGVDDGKSITVNVGSGFSDGDRASYWEERDTLAGQVVEVRADAITQNQDGTYSLRFPRFIRFRGFIAGEKI